MQNVMCAATATLFVRIKLSRWQKRLCYKSKLTFMFVDTSLQKNDRVQYRMNQENSFLEAHILEIIIIILNIA